MDVGRVDGQLRVSAGSWPVEACTTNSEPATLPWKSWVAPSSLSMDCPIPSGSSARPSSSTARSPVPEFVVQASTGQLPADTRKLTLAVDPANVHLFDPQTTKRLGRV